MDKPKFSPDKVVEVATVYETYDYDSFKHVKGNRKIDKRHVDKLRKSMDKRLLLTPIIVNVSGYIKDGQHRFEARKALELPIPYIVDGLNGKQILMDVQTYNSSSRNWSLINFIESQCELKNENYMRLYNLLKIYPHFKPITILTLLQNKSECSAVPTGFKEGLFSFPEKEVSRVDNLCSKITELGQYFEYFNDRRFVTAAMLLIRTKGYNHSHFLAKFANNNLSKKSNVYDYWHELVWFYNRYERRHNKVSFQFQSGN